MDYITIQLVSFTTFVTKDLYMENLLLMVEVIRDMKKKSIIFGSLLAVFLMLMIPNVSAIQYITLEHETTKLARNMSEDEIKNAILQRIQQLEKPITLNINMTDPDGPLEGGLDDFFDFVNLIFGLIGTISLGYALVTIFLSQNIFSTLKNIFYSGYFTFLDLIYFGEAFDILESPPADGR